MSPLPLLQSTDLTYQGGFKVPIFGTTDPTTLNYGGQNLLYRPSTNTLMLTNILAKQVAEISVVAPVIGTAAQMNRATLVQPLTDVTQGRRTDAGFSQSPALAGLLEDQTGRLIVSVISTYDAGSGQTKSHLVSGTNFAALPTVPPPSVVYGAVGQPKYDEPGFTAGVMCRVPDAYQTLLGKPYLTGQGCQSIISRTSWGPSATTFDPQALDPNTPALGVRVVGYDDTAGGAHETLGDGKSGPLFSRVSRIFGMIWPSQTRSVLFIGRNATPPTIYGSGTNDSAKAGFDATGSQTPPYTPCNGCPDPWVYDPVSLTHGFHGYPYMFFVWAYDAEDFVAVVQGLKQPWEVVPYATWSLAIPNMPTGDADMIGGATYKEATKQIMITARKGGDGTRPVVYVFQLP